MANDCSATVEILKVLISTIIIVIGWVVVHKLSVARDRDSSRREMIIDAANLMMKDIDDVFIHSYNYHSSIRDKSIEIALKMSLQDLSYRITQLKDITADENEIKLCRNTMLEMKKAISMKHFEEEHDGPIDQNSQQIQTIALTTLKLKQTFLKLKHNQFSIKK